MKYNEVMKQLENLGTDQAIKIYKNHGADIDLFGVSIANIKKLVKKIKFDHELGMRLLNSSNVDAMYLGQYIVDFDKLTIGDYDNLVSVSNYYMILDNVLAPLIAKNKNLSKKILYDWIESSNDRKRQVAYSLYSIILGSYKNEDIEIDHVKKYLLYIQDNIHNEENRVRYSMNNFLISAGAAFSDLTVLSKSIAKSIGKVNVNMGKTSCKVPDAYSYVEKIEKMGNVGKKRKI